MSEDDRLRIIHCIRAPVGGVFRHVRDLIAAQAKAGHAVGFICDSTTGGTLEQKLLGELKPHLALGLVQMPMNRAPGVGDAVTVARLFRPAAAMRPSIIHGHGAKGGIYARLLGTLLRLAGHPTRRIYSPHGGSLHYDPGSTAGRLYFGVERLLERFTDSLVFVSRFEEETYAAKIGRPFAATTLVYNGVSEAEYEPVRPVATAADFLFFGEMRDLKGTDVFLRAIFALADRGLPVSATLIGPGTDRPRYEAMVARSGHGDRIRFHDSMPVREAIALGRVVVVPSRAESMPYVVLETIAAGRPLIATAVGGIPDIFADAADRLVAPGNVDALATAMAEALADPMAIEARAARLRAAIRPVFSVDVMAARVEDVYRRLAERPIPPSQEPAEPPTASHPAKISTAA